MHPKQLFLLFEQMNYKSTYINTHIRACLNFIITMYHRDLNKHT